MQTQRSPDTILEQIAAIPSLERGRLCEMRGKSGRVYHNLQFWNNGRNRCEYIRSEDLAAVDEAVANYRQYKKLTDEYAAAVERRTHQKRRSGQDNAEKKGSATRRRTPPAKRSGPSSID